MTQMDRRRFVAAISGGLIGANVSGAAGAKNEVPMTTLGRTKLRVSRIALGTTQAPSRSILAYCLQQGVNFIDTAPNYSQYKAERALGELFGALQLKRDTFILATKNKSRNPSEWPKLITESCQRMGTDRLDIFYAHSIGGRGGTPEDSTTWLLKPEVERAVKELKRSGLIQAFGYTVHLGNGTFVNELMRQSAKGEHIDVVMVRYNFRDYGDHELAASLEIAHKAGQGVIAMKTQSGAKAVPDKVKPFLGGDFNNWQAAIRWAASNPNVHAVCANLRALEHARDDIAAIRQPRLSAREFERLKTHAQATAAGACRMCASCAAACPRGIAIPDVLRALMYHDDYGDRPMGRQTYSEIGRAWRPDRCEDCGTCERICPNGLAVRGQLARARRVLAAG